MNCVKRFVAMSLAFGLLSAPVLSKTTELSDKFIEVAGARSISCPGGNSNCMNQQRQQKHLRSQIPNSYKRKAPSTFNGKYKPSRNHAKPCPIENPRCGGHPLPPPPGGHKPPKHKHHPFDYWWTPGYYWNPGYAFVPPSVYANYRVSCNEARFILRYEGFRNIKLQKCGGTYHRFKAQRRGKNYLIKVRARSGQITIVRRL